MFVPSLPVSRSVCVCLLDVVVRSSSSSQSSRAPEARPVINACSTKTPPLQSTLHQIVLFNTLVTGNDPSTTPQLIVEDGPMWVFCRKAQLWDAYTKPTWAQKGKTPMSSERLNLQKHHVGVLWGTLISGPITRNNHKNIWFIFYVISVDICTNKSWNSSL